MSYYFEITRNKGILVILHNSNGLDRPKGLNS